MYIDELLKNNPSLSFLDSLDPSATNFIQLDFGETLLRPDDKVDGIYLLLEGKLKISLALANGKNLLLRFSTPISIIGDIEAFDAYLVETFVEAVRTSTLLHIPQIVVDQTLKENISFLHFMIRHLSFKLFSLSHASGFNQRYSVQTRFASYLMSLATISDSQQSPSTSLTRDIRLKELEGEQFKDIAELLGTSYRHLSRIMNQWIQDGLIKKNGKKITILNEKKLEEFSEGNLYE